MAVTKLTEVAKEGSTYAVTVAFTDENGDAVTPSAVTWTLMNLRREVINSREDVSITPGTSVTIVLSGNDLLVGTDNLVTRELLVKATYDSDLGSDLPLREARWFDIQGFVGV